MRFAQSIIEISTNVFYKDWTVAKLINLKSAILPKTKYSSKYAAFEVLENKPLSINLFNKLEDKAEFSANKNKEKHLYSKVKKGINQEHFLQNINKQD